MGYGDIFCAEHFLAMLLICILAVLLLSRNVLSERVHQGSMWIILLTCAMLIAQDLLESYAQLDPSRRELRLISSVLGYALRPVAVLGFLLVIWPVNRPRWYLWIPAALNGLLYGTAFFLPLTFYFDETYSFQRGPMNAAAFVCSILYLAVTLLMIHRRFRDRRIGDIIVIYLCTLGCLAATVMDIYISGFITVPAILIASMTFYLFLRTQDLDHDVLTGLWSRLSFYEDCRTLRNTVTAVASLDMNGLKQINDRGGHEAGDQALQTIAHALRGIMSRRVIAYRIGGDEFMVLFLRCGELEVRQCMDTVTEEVGRNNLAVAAGVALRQEGDYTLEDMIRISDQRMYEAKSGYYRLHDRRRERRER